MTPYGVRWAANHGKLPCTFTSTGQRRFAVEDLDRFLGREPATVERPRVEAWYCRVSGTTGQESSLANQEGELARTATGEVFKVYRDRASGLRSNRKGLDRLLDDAAAGRFTVVRVCHEDRLARFGVDWIRRYLTRCGVGLEVLHTRAGLSLPDELLADFMALVASFSGRFYQMRSKQNQRRLLEVAMGELERP